MARADITLDATRCPPGRHSQPRRVRSGSGISHFGPIWSVSCLGLDLQHDCCRSRTAANLQPPPKPAATDIAFTLGVGSAAEAAPARESSQGAVRGCHPLPTCAVAK